MLPPRLLALALLVVCSTAPVSDADGQLPPPAPPPPAAPPSPEAVPPVVPAKPAAEIPANAAKAVLDRMEHDFGVAKQEDELKTEFTLTNEGRSTLTIELRVDCGCSAAMIDVKELEPGASAKIRVNLRTFTSVGVMIKRVHVLTNDPVHPMIEIKLKVDVSAGVVLDPARFYFGFVEVGAAPSLTIKVQWKDGVGAPFELASCEVPGLDVDLSTKKFDAAPWHGYEVTASFRKPPPIGTVSGTAVLRTSGPDAKRFTAAVTAFVSGKVFVDRREVSLGLLPEGKERTVMVGCRALKPGIDLGVVTAKARNGRVAARAIRAQEEWLIEIKSPEGAAAGRLDDVVEVTSSLVPETAEIGVKGEILAKKD